MLVVKSGMIGEDQCLPATVFAVGATLSWHEHGARVEMNVDLHSPTNVRCFSRTCSSAHAPWAPGQHLTSHLSHFTFWRRDLRGLRQAPSQQNGRARQLSLGRLLDEPNRWPGWSPGNSRRAGGVSGEGERVLCSPSDSRVCYFVTELNSSCDCNYHFRST
jgi:hypothetical protein